MIVLAIADKNPQINITEPANRESVDLIITLGDLLREDLLTAVEIKNIPKIGVSGNHDSGNYMEEIGIINMHLSVWEFGGLAFGGFQGCVRYKADPEAIMYTQDQANQMMMNFPRVDVFLAHCPPRGINDEEEIAHQGFDALRTYVDTFQPTLLLHGHTYPTADNVVTQHNKTRIEYISKYRLVVI